MSDSADVRTWVRRYLAEGWAPVPIPAREKGPRVVNWQTRTFTEEDFAPGDNIGLRLGAPSGGLVDVDLDAAEAVALAPHFLPPTGRVHGRASKPRSHYYFIPVIAEDGKPRLKYAKYKDVDGSVLVEVRATGQQTMVPPSVHPSGEAVVWEVEREPGRIADHVLAATAAALATSALLARHWPSGGSRHELAGAVAGLLAATRLEPRVIEAIVANAAELARDEDVEDRARFARETIATVRGQKDGQKDRAITGAPRVGEIVGIEIVKRIRAWFGLGDAAFDDVVAELNAQRFGVRLGKDYVYGLEPEVDPRDPTAAHVIFQPPRALVEEFLHQRVRVGTKKVKGDDGDTREVPVYKSKFEVWREHPHKRTYRTVTFAPPPRACDPRDYNLWTGFAVEPLAPPDPLSNGDLAAWLARDVQPRCLAYLELLHEVICSANTAHYEYLLDLLAFTVQAPGLPSEIACVLKGEMGAGKGTFVRHFGRLFGRHYTQLDKTEHLAGKFNVALSGKVVVFADEAFFAGDRRDLGSLKRLITEPTLAIERKGIDVVEEPNFVHLFMATNEDWAHQAGMRERRFFTLHVSDARTQDLTYFARIVAQLQEENGYAALLTLLLHRPVTHDRIRRVPKTDELRVQQELSLDPELKWWREKLADGAIEPDIPWPATVEPQTLFMDYIRWCDTMKVNRRATKIDLLRRVLEPWLGERQKQGGERVRTLLPLGEARTLFDTRFGTTIPWPDVDAAVTSNADLF